MDGPSKPGLKVFKGQGRANSRVLEKKVILIAKNFLTPICLDKVLSEKIKNDDLNPEKNEARTNSNKFPRENTRQELPMAY